MEYIIKKVVKKPSLSAGWDSSDWADANIAEIKNFRQESSSHRPETKLKLKYDATGIYGLFKVKDQYVRSVNSGFQNGVCGDSCVEFFFKPGVGKGYFNLECNCGGAILCFYVTDPTRGPEKGLKEFVKLTDKDCGEIKIFHSMPEIVEPEIKEETEWYLGFFFPFHLIAKYAGELGELSGKEWTANFYKCGDKTSHPHWASWNPVSELNFHLPQCFGKIKFES
jgi:hypothetical protein